MYPAASISRYVRSYSERTSSGVCRSASASIVSRHAQKSLAGRASAHGALERVAVGVHEARKSQRARHARDATTACRPKAPSRTGDPSGVRPPLLFAVSWVERRSIPNALTIARFVAIPVFVWLYLEAGDGPAWGAGHLLRGCRVHRPARRLPRAPLARRVGFGKVADPLADRLMIGTAAILMLATGRIPILAALVILGRDVALVLGYRILSPGGYELEVTFLGKLATWVLYASLGLVLVTPEGTTWPIVLLWIGVALSLGAGVQYGLRAWRHAHRRKGLSSRARTLED